MPTISSAFRVPVRFSKGTNSPYKGNKFPAFLTAPQGLQIPRITVTNSPHIATLQRAAPVAFFSVRSLFNADHRRAAARYQQARETHSISVRKGCPLYPCKAYGYGLPRQAAFVPKSHACAVKLWGHKRDACASVRCLRYIMPRCLQSLLGGRFLTENSTAAEKGRTVP